jgi:arylesterase/paraoxonase
MRADNLTMRLPLSMSVVTLVAACALVDPPPGTYASRLLKVSCSEIPSDTNGVAPGPEDIVVDRLNQVAYVSSTDRRSIQQGLASTTGDQSYGHIYRMDLTQSPPLLLDVTPAELLRAKFRPHGMSLYQKDGQTWLMVIDHPPKADKEPPGKLCGGPSAVHIMEASGPGRLVTRGDPITNALMPNPNDIAAVSETSFYVTNTYGSSSCISQFIEPIFGSRGFVSYYDGKKFSSIEGGGPMPNGIAYNKARNRLYVSSTVDGGIRSFNATPPATREGQPLWTGGHLDNIDLDSKGDGFFVASHPSFWRFLKHSFGYGSSPSQVFKVDLTDLKAPLALVYSDEEGVNGSAVSTMTSYRHEGREIVLLGNVFESRPRMCTVQ